MRENGPVTPSQEAEPGLEEQPARQRPRRIGLFLIVAAIALTLDVVSKVIVVTELESPTQPPVRLLGGVFYLDVARNSGAAFSLGAGFTVLLTIIAAVVVFVILRAAARMRSVGWAVALGLILGGALGNLSDRVFRAPGPGRGHVVDWISLFGPYGRHWPIFNLADSAIVCGAILSAILALRGTDLDGHTARDNRG